MLQRIVQRGRAGFRWRLGLVVVLTFAGATAISCEERSSSSAGASVDSEMQEAINRGQSTLPLFVRAFREPREDWFAFQFRYSFNNEGGYLGTVWLELESIEADGSFVGLIAADEDTTAIPFGPGDRLTVDSSQVTDWSFLDSRGRWYGGYTLRVTLDRRLGTGIDPADNIHGGTEFMDLGDPEQPDEDEEPGDGPQ